MNAIAGQSIMDVVSLQGMSIESAFFTALKSNLGLTDVLSANALVTIKEHRPLVIETARAERVIHYQDAVTIANQSAIDLALQYYGNVEGLIDLALKNGLSTTQRIPSGSIIKYQMNSTEVAEYYKNENINIATEVVQELTNTNSFELPGEFPYSL